ncbi:protein psiQ [Musca domestica]|uniref:Protein psiQ n=1 Tax=Musca domestica TaxID=7370 RepID=A0A1I8MYC7_MUSDO|nr:protein psiQ [Musca domestica]
MYLPKGIATYGCLGILLVFASLTPRVGAIKCLKCSSNDDQNCLDYTKIVAADCAEGVEMCFTSNDGGVITRGCLQKDQPCEASTCKSCTGDSCNNHNICKKCSTDDADCSQTDGSLVKYNEICESSTTQCFVQVKDKKVERRCATADDSCNNDTTCKKTDGSISNAGYFPTKRIHCYQCAQTDCSDVSVSAVPKKPCRNYVDNDECYMTAESATAVTRGCKSDDNAKCGTGGGEQGCVTCQTDNCNNSTYERQQKLKCIQCQGTDCYKEQAAAEAKDCEKKILYSDKEACFTLVADGDIQRSCLHNDAATKEKCEKAGDACKVCSNEDGCNRSAESSNFQCIVCRSDENKDCWNDASKVSGKKCRTGESSPEEGCFHGIWNGVAIRGCYIDADAQTQAICSDAKNKQCTLCHTANCNTGKSSNGAQAVGIFVGLIIAMLSVIWYTN